MKILGFCLLLFCSLASLSQEQKTENWMLYPNSEKENVQTENKNFKGKPVNAKVTLIQDSRLEDLLAKEIRINEKNPKIKGFRIQIFYGSGPNSRNMALTTQSDFIKNFQAYQSYLIYQAPNFKIRVGDFRNRLEAEKAILEIKSVFENAFIVKDEISIPPLEN